MLPTVHTSFYVADPEAMKVRCHEVQAPRLFLNTAADNHRKSDVVSKAYRSVCSISALRTEHRFFRRRRVEAFQKSLRAELLRGTCFAIAHLMLLTCSVQRNNQLVWNESIRIVEEMFGDRWNSPVVKIDDVLDVTSSVLSIQISTYSFATHRLPD